MSMPSGPFDVRAMFDPGADERTHEWLRMKAVEAGLPKGSLAAEFIDELLSGRANGRDLLLSGQYAAVLEPAARRAAQIWSAASDDERAAQAAETSKQIDEWERRQRDGG